MRTVFCDKNILVTLTYYFRMTSAEALTHPFIVGLPIPAGIQQRQENLLNNADEILRRFVWLVNLILLC